MERVLDGGPAGRFNCGLGMHNWRVIYGIMMDWSLLVFFVKFRQGLRVCGVEVLSERGWKDCGCCMLTTLKKAR